MIKIERLLFIALVLCMLIVLSTSSFAVDDDIALYRTDSTHSNVLISTEIPFIPENVIENLASRYEEDCLIIIYNYGEASKS